MNFKNYARKVLDGKAKAPFGWDKDTRSYQSYLRSLGYRSSLEEENERLRNREWYGLEGKDW